MKVTIPHSGLTFDLNKKQAEFVDSEARYPLLIGGMGSGKTLALIIKALIHSSVPNNYGLIGRENLSDLKVSVWNDFFDLVPQRYLARVNRSDHLLTFPNGSQILFKQLKAVSKNDLRSLNLGWFAIEQAEETSEEVFLELQGRLRRKQAKIRQGFLIANPSVSWLMKYWKQENNPDFQCIETSTFDNQANLPPDYLTNMTTGKPEWWIKQFVYGVWDTSLLAEKAVFGAEAVAKAEAASSAATEAVAGHLTTYEEPVKGQEYVIGIDPTEGTGGDPAHMCGFNIRTGVQVFDWSAQMAPELLAQEAAALSDRYNNAYLVPEINGAGYATTAILKTEGYGGRIWRRKEYDRANQTFTDRLGFRTTAATKPLMIARLSEQVTDGSMTLKSKMIVAEMHTFVYTDDARKHSMGAEIGYHDDGIMAAALAGTAIYEYAGKGKVVGIADQLTRGETNTVVVRRDNTITPPVFTRPNTTTHSWQSA